MKKYKNAAQNTITKLSQIALLYAGVVGLMNANAQWQLVVMAFGVFWIATDVSIWAMKFIVRPAAKAIYEANR